MRIKPITPQGFLENEKWIKESRSFFESEAGIEFLNALDDNSPLSAMARVTTAGATQQDVGVELGMMKGYQLALNQIRHLCGMSGRTTKASSISSDYSVTEEQNIELSIIDENATNQHSTQPGK